MSSLGTQEIYFRKVIKRSNALCITINTKKQKQLIQIIRINIYIYIALTRTHIFDDNKITLLSYSNLIIKRSQALEIKCLQTEIRQIFCIYNTYYRIYRRSKNLRVYCVGKKDTKCIIKIVSVPYNVRSFIIFDNDVTLNLT